jgi:hypothetical protein
LKPIRRNEKDFAKRFRAAWIFNKKFYDKKIRDPTTTDGRSASRTRLLVLFDMSLASTLQKEKAALNRFNRKLVEASFLIFQGGGSVLFKKGGPHETPTQVGS